MGPLSSNVVYSHMDYSDLSQRQFTSHRCVNPLNPNYHVAGPDNLPQELGVIAKNQPNAMKFHLRNNDLYRSMDLKTKDIRGAQPDQRMIDANFINH